MTNSPTRRRFFGNALATAGLLETSALAATDTTHIDAEDYYDKLGVTKIINAAGTYTMFTASIMPPSVQTAVAKAAKHPVRLAELQKKAGEYIAKKLKCEAALVSAGAASALTLGAAACMTRRKPESARFPAYRYLQPEERSHRSKNAPLRLRSRSEELRPALRGDRDARRI